MANTVVVTDETFNDLVLNSDKPVLVDFWATWCGPCIAVAPILDQIAGEQVEKLTIAKLDVDQNPNIAMQFGITSIPTMKLFKNGKEVKTIIGARPKPAIESELADIIG